MQLLRKHRCPASNATFRSFLDDFTGPRPRTTPPDRVSGPEWVLGRNGLLSDLQPKREGGEERIEEAHCRFVNMPMLQID